MLSRGSKITCGLYHPLANKSLGILGTPITCGFGKHHLNFGADYDYSGAPGALTEGDKWTKVKQNCTKSLTVKVPIKSQHAGLEGASMPLCCAPQRHNKGPAGWNSFWSMFCTCQPGQVDTISGCWPTADLPRKNTNRAALLETGVGHSDLLFLLIALWV